MIALFPTRRTLQWLKTTKYARILHRFDQVCNLVNERNEIVSLVTRRIGKGPFSMVLDKSLSAEWRHDTPVTVHQPSIQIGRTAIRVDTTSIWNARPEWTSLQALNFDQLPQASQLPDAFQPKTTDLIRAIMTDNSHTLHKSAEWLAGRGSGLTPIGDDILTGILFALHVWQPESIWFKQIVTAAASRTTTVSANFLQAAAAGEAVAAWHDLVSAETNTKPAAVERILAVGANSGADAWSGFVQACTLFSQHTFETT